MNIDLSGRKAIVGGASRGIGRAAALELARLGASVTVISRNADSLEKVRAALDTAKGQKHLALVADAAKTAALKDAVTAHVKKNGSFHILINNSGGPPAGPVHTAKEEDFIAAFAQHLLANHVMVQALLPGMRMEKYGRIVNVISTSVKTPIKGLGVSNTIRGAVASWAKTLSMEVAGDGITVNNILPGATDTDRLEEIIKSKAARHHVTVEEIIAAEKAEIPAGRFGAPEELAQAIAFLCSPAASYINGINVPVDGGRTASL
jgi:3-oxoacyl-[acyl-carrier protein] reductase